MKRIISVLVLTTFIANVSFAITVQPKKVSIINKVAKLDIKIKNDSGDEVSVINAGSGGTYRLQKNVTTNIKMEAGDKLYTYVSGKKGKLILTASSDMVGKVLLYSKL